MQRLVTARRGGWSFIEALIVVAIIGIVGTMAFVYMVQARTHAQLEQAEIVVSRVLKEARNKAVSEELIVNARFDVGTSELWYEWVDPTTGTTMSEPRQALPDQVSFSESGIPFHDGVVVFTQRGSLVSGGSLASGGTIDLVNINGETATLTANVATGHFPLVGGNLR